MEKIICDPDGKKYFEERLMNPQLLCKIDLDDGKPRSVLLSDLIAELNGGSTSEAKRLIKQGGVTVLTPILK